MNVKRLKLLVKYVLLKSRVTVTTISGHNTFFASILIGLVQLKSTNKKKKT